jgi:hypothetical protein
MRSNGCGSLSSFSSANSYILSFVARVLLNAVPLELSLPNPPEYSHAHSDPAIFTVVLKPSSLLYLPSMTSIFYLLNIFQHQVTMGGAKAKFFWFESQQKAFGELKHRLCSASVLTLPDLQQPFEIETDASDYAIGSVLTQHGHLVAYHSETLSDTVRKYPTYDKEMYSIVQACLQWKHYILGKETVIHIDHRPLQFIQTQGKLQNNRHQK